MDNSSLQEILQKDSFYQHRFTDINLNDSTLENKVFESCRFEKCHFNKTQFIGCRFVDCEFSACDLSLAKVKQTAFNEVVFDESKLIGINWTEAKWPYIHLSAAIKFYQCNISHSSFYHENLSGIIIDGCKAHDTDFREGDFSDGSFVLTDFENSHFMHTKLCSADFTDATNYNIHPNENDISKAKFSMPDVTNLLLHFDISIQY